MQFERMMKRTREEFESSGVEIDSMNIANALMLLSKESSTLYHQDHHGDNERVFECKTCNRQFASFQALGGHRASHKKPKILTGEEEEGQKEERAMKRKMHECSICGVEFKIGQALGGHMRRHRGTTGGFVEKKESATKRIMLFGFDLTAVV